MPSSNRATPPAPPPSVSPHALRARPKPGTGRLGIISGYFQLCGIGGLIQTLPLAAGSLVSRTQAVSSPKLIVVLVVGALMTFGFFRTSRLLDQRRRSGGLLAILCLLMSVTTAVASSVDWVALLDLGVSVVGLGLIASVWKYLEKD